MTHKDFSTIQRMLGFIEGAIFGIDKSVNCGILDAIEVIDAILEKELRTGGKPCCFCDPIDPLLNCYQRKDDNTDV